MVLHTSQKALSEDTRGRRAADGISPALEERAAAPRCLLPPEPPNLGMAAPPHRAAARHRHHHHHRAGTGPFPPSSGRIGPGARRGGGGKARQRPRGGGEAAPGGLPREGSARYCRPALGPSGHTAGHGAAGTPVGALRNVRDSQKAVF